MLGYIFVRIVCFRDFLVFYFCLAFLVHQFEGSCQFVSYLFVGIVHNREAFARLEELFYCEFVHPLLSEGETDEVVRLYSVFRVVNYFLEFTYCSIIASCLEEELTQFESEFGVGGAFLDAALVFLNLEVQFLLSACIE